MSSLSYDFWSLVGEKADMSELEIGDTFYLERGDERSIKVVIEKWDDPDKGQQFTIRTATLAEVEAHPPEIAVVTE